MNIEDFFHTHDGFPTYQDVWNAAQQAERERIKQLVLDIGVQGNHNEWFDCCDTIRERIQDDT